MSLHCYTPVRPVHCVSAMHVSHVWRTTTSCCKCGLLVLCRLIEIGFEKMVVAMDAKEAAAMVRL